MKRKRKYNWLIAIFIILIVAYILFFQKPTVTYQGESENWAVSLYAERTGGKGNNKIIFYYKGQGEIPYAEYSIYPYYGGGYINLDERGSYRYECDDCEFNNSEDHLMIFITWRENDSTDEVEMDLFELNKIK